MNFKETMPDINVHLPGRSRLDMFFKKEFWKNLQSSPENTCDSILFSYKE